MSMYSRLIGTQYEPVKTEFEGLIEICYGSFCLGFSGLIEIDNRIEGCKHTFLFNDDAAKFWKRLGINSIKQGFRQVLPTAGLLLTTYLVSSKILMDN